MVNSLKTMVKLLGAMLSLAVFIAVTAPTGEQRANADEPAQESPKAPAGEPAKTPKIEITLDTSDAPEMADWADKAKKACEDNYPMIVKHLGEDGFTPPEKTKIVFKKMNGVAYTAGDTITCSAKWFTDHPDDVGAVIHELCHVVQGYRSKQPPSWVTEGIADFVRWFNFEPEKRHPQIRNPDKAKYIDSYQTTAAFFDWIVKNKDPQFVTRLNAAARTANTSPNCSKSTPESRWTTFGPSLFSR